MGAKATMKFKILSHFVKRSIFLTPMETIIKIPRKLEYLEGLVKLVRKKKNVEGQRSQIAAIQSTPAIKRVTINKTHHNKTLHLVVEINQELIEGLVDIGASILVMVASVVRKLNIMHLVACHETYKTTSSIMMQALGRIVELQVKVGRIICEIIFLVVDIDSYDLFLGLDFLIKIRVVVNVEKGVIQVHNGHGMEVEVLPLNVMNMLQVLKRSEEEKCNKKMGHLQINNEANMLGS